MIDLQSIARQLRIPADQLRLAADLIQQGCEPAFIQRYRSDETGCLSREVLWSLKLAVERQQRLAQAREKAAAHLPADVILDSEAKQQLASAESEVEVDAVVRAFRARRALVQNAENDVAAGQLVEKLIGYSGPNLDDVALWVQSELGCDRAAAETALQDCQRLIANILAGDAGLGRKLRQTIQRRANAKVALIVSKESDSDDAVQPPETNAAEQVSTSATSPSVDTESTSDTIGDTHPEASDDPFVDEEHFDVHAESGSDEDAHDSSSEGETSEGETSEQATSEGESTEIADANSSLSFGGQSSKGIARKGKRKRGKEPKQNTPASKVSPRQRRRRWLTSLLQPFNGLDRPLSKLSSYQHLMLGRGRRSQIVKVDLAYDRNVLISIARDTLVNETHPLAGWFTTTVHEALAKSIGPKIEQDAVTELEEYAQQKLLETAAEPLRDQLMQRPVRGHRIMVIDTVGPKATGVAIIDAHGKVLHTDEMTCSAQPASVAQNVANLGQLVHHFKVTLIGLTNGPARRFLIHTIREYFTQHSENRVRWTMVDRGGADAYATSRSALQELPEYNRRDRASIWVARRLQDPLREIIKLDPSRLRLGSYQRELPADTLRKLVHDTISDCVCSRAIDTLNASVAELVCVPGVQPAQAKQIVALASQGKINSREDLLAQVNDWPDLASRQSLGFLRIYGTSNPLDATGIHPEDYRLAQRMIQNTDLQEPPTAPLGWKKPTPLTNQPPTPASAAIEATELAASLDETANTESAVEPTEAEASTADASLENTSPAEIASADAPVSEASSEAEAKPKIEYPVEDEISPEYSENVIPPTTVEAKMDVEKLARGWQVGREKVRWVGNCLADPFGDLRLRRPAIPMLSQMPSLENLQPDVCLWAVVVGVADFGAFVELGPECGGLIHISRLSPHFVEDPHQCVQIGDLIQAWVVSVDAKKRRVAMTALSPEQRAQAEAADRQRDAQRSEDNWRGKRRDQAESNVGGHSRANRDRNSRQENRGRKGGQGQGNQGGQQGGQGGRRGGKRGQDRRSQESETRSVVVTSKKPKAPITEGMEKGTEPLRSFSDLLQFYEKKRTDPPETPPAPPEKNDGQPGTETPDVS